MWRGGVVVEWLVEDVVVQVVGIVVPQVGIVGAVEIEVEAVVVAVVSRWVPCMGFTVGGSTATRTYKAQGMPMP